MGLDMYLEKKTYVKNWEHMKPDALHQIIVKKGGKVRTDIKAERIKEIVEEVACWRKSNHIHNWFVENVQEDNDDCKEYYVSREQLAKLVEICKEVVKASKLVDGEISNGYTFEKDGNIIKKIPILVKGQYIENPTVAQNLLPTQSGFFFGSTDYDQYYLEDVKYTIDALEPVLKEGDNGDFYYSSSW